MELESYLTSIKNSLESDEVKISLIVDEIKKAKKRGSRVWVLGNGGSLAIAQHFAQDLLKMYSVRAQCLNDPSIITAYANDEAFGQCFAMPLKILLDKDDLVIAFSCSGSSSNYQIIFSQFKCFKIAIVGTDGGFMKRLSNIFIHAKSESYQVCEAAFGIVADLINIGLEDS